MKEPWAVFYLGDKELAAYTLRGTGSLLRRSGWFMNGGS